eukprot:gene9107-11159_t
MIDTCFDISTIEWRSGNNKLTLNEYPLKIQGIAWFGLETDSYSPGGLDITTVEKLLDFLKSTGFNALRIPFSVDMILNHRYPSKIDYTLNPNLKGKTALDVIEYIIQKCAERGILIVLEQHRFDPSSYIPPLCWNLWALDIKNEPHDPATWGTGNITTDWNKAFERISNDILARTNFNGVFMIEGIQSNPICTSPENNWWGGNMEPVKCFPIYLAEPQRIVWAPHTFCSSVFDQAYFNDANYPNNMPSIWENQFGFLSSHYYGLVMGEWGCKVNSTKNDKWVKAFANYLNSKNVTNHLFFALNPDSADTDSPLNADWKTPKPSTLTYLNQILPNPTKFYQTGQKICIADGSTSSSSTTGILTTSSGTSTTGSPPTTGSPTSTTTTTSTSTTSSTRPSTTGSSTTTSTSSTTTSPATTTSTSSTTSPTTSSTSSTTTTSTGTSTSTTKPSTTTTSTSGTTTGSSTSTTTSSSTTGSVPAPNIVVYQSLASRWSDSQGKVWSLYNGEVVNKGTVTAKNIKFTSSPNKVPDQIWGFDNTNTATIIWTLTWYPTLNPNQSAGFGYIIQSSSPMTFTLI